jgi:hypothetical protein
LVQYFNEEGTYCEEGEFLCLTNGKTEFLALLNAEVTSQTEILFRILEHSHASSVVK